MHTAVEDAGMYTCIVSNTAGEERKNFNLDILGKDNKVDIFYYTSLYCIVLFIFVNIYNCDNILKVYLCKSFVTSRKRTMSLSFSLIQQFLQALRMRDPWSTLKSKRNTTLLSPVRCQVI